MGTRYYIDLCRQEYALASYFPALEIKTQPEDEWIEDVLIPALLPVVRRTNKKISEVPIVFWAFTRKTARSFREELFLLMTPANPGALAWQTIREALLNIEEGMVFQGGEFIPNYAVPVCQIFRGKLIRFYAGNEEYEPHFLPAFEWEEKGPAFKPAYLEHSSIMLENRESEILFMRANINTVINGDYYRKYQQALNCIGMEEE